VRTQKRAGKLFTNNYDMEICAMDNLLGKGISGIYYFSFNLGYYYSAGYFTCKKEYIPFLDELEEYKRRLYT
jgi:hypothetical protein